MKNKFFYFMIAGLFLLLFYPGYSFCDDSNDNSEYDSPEIPDVLNDDFGIKAEGEEDPDAALDENASGEGFLDEENFPEPKNPITSHSEWEKGRSVMESDSEMDVHSETEAGRSVGEDEDEMGVHEEKAE